MVAAVHHLSLLVGSCVVAAAVLGIVYALVVYDGICILDDSKQLRRKRTATRRAAGGARR